MTLDEVVNASQRLTRFGQPMHRLEHVGHLRPDLQLGRRPGATHLLNRLANLSQQDLGAPRLKEKRWKSPQVARTWGDSRITCVDRGEDDALQ